MTTPRHAADDTNRTSAAQHQTNHTPEHAASGRQDAQGYEKKPASEDMKPESDRREAAGSEASTTETDGTEAPHKTSRKGRHSSALGPKEVRAKKPFPIFAVHRWDDEDVPASQYKKRKEKAKLTPVIDVLDRININIALGTAIYAFCCIFSVLLTAFFIEYLWNQEFLFTMGLTKVLVNLFMVTIAFVIFHMLCLQTRASLFIFPLVGFIWGLANYYVLQFKGSVFTPADLFALGTAAEVAEGYNYTPPTFVVVSAVVLVVFAVFVILFCPRHKMRLYPNILRLAVAVILAASCAGFLNTFSIEEDGGIQLDTWTVNNTYRSYGTLLTFIMQVQQLKPQAPDGYSEQAVEDILDAYPDETEEYDGTIIDAYEAAGYTAPTVITVMNETFADLSVFEDLTGTVAQTPLYDAIASDARLSGWTYVGVLGGGTCNSEMEYLTGNSLITIGAEKYPYVIYDLSEAGSMAKELNAQGYRTSSMHPAPSTNWNREVAYNSLGFDHFYSIDSFEGAEMLRDMVTDKETYNLVLDLLNDYEDPQFIFDVTIMNHSNYETGMIPGDMFYTIDVPAFNWLWVNEYLSSIHAAELDLLYLVNELDKIDRPIVLTFFGDHQPYFSRDIWSTYNEDRPFEEGELGSIQTAYQIPYMVWENQAQRQQRMEMQEAGVEIFDAPQDSYNPTLTAAYDLSGELIESAIPFPDDPDAEASVDDVLIDADGMPIEGVEGAEDGIVIDEGGVAVPEDEAVAIDEGGVAAPEETAIAPEAARDADMMEAQGGTPEASAAIDMQDTEASTGEPSAEEGIVEDHLDLPYMVSDWTLDNTDIVLDPVIFDQPQFETRMAEAAVEFATRPHIPSNGLHETVVSLNYLGGYSLGTAGLPLTRYRLFLAQMHEYIPAVTALGYMTPDGQWHYSSETTQVSPWLHDYAILQYNRLFHNG